MRTVFTLLFLLINICGSAQSGQQIASQITNATIYLQGAQLIRQAKVNLKVGNSELVFNNLSSDINENSIQVAGLGEATISSLKYSIDYLEEPKLSQQSQTLTDRLDNIALQISQKENNLASLTKEQEVLDTNQKVYSEASALELFKLKEIATYHRTRSNTILDEKYVVTQALKELEKKSKQIENELQKLQGTIKQLRGSIVLKINSESPQQLQLQLKYTVRNAGWYPTYDIKANDITQPLSIQYKANIYQQTGTDWEDITVSLSTGNPNTQNLKPEVNPYYLNFIRPPVAYSYKKSAAARGQDRLQEEALQEEEYMEGAPEADIVETLSAPLSYNNTVQNKLEGITSTKFDIIKKYTIASNQETTMIDIDNFSTPALYSHYSAPVIDENVYLTAKIGNWEQYNLLEGEAAVYFEGSYAGKTVIDPLATTDSLTISLGQDPGISVDRKQINEYKSKSFAGGTRVVDQSYEISIKNNKSVPLQLILEDRIPVSQNKDIKVEDYKLGNAKFNTEKGILRWDVNLLPKATEKKRFSYQIKYPKNLRINL